MKKLTEYCVYYTNTIIKRHFVYTVYRLMYYIHTAVICMYYIHTAVVCMHYIHTVVVCMYYWAELTRNPTTWSCSWFCQSFRRICRTGTGP